jgi:hypothetical protein
VSSPPYSPDLTYLWGIVNRAVRDPELRSRPGGVTQNIWQSYQQTYLSQGLTPPALSIQTVNSLVQTAAAQARAEAALQEARSIFRRTGFDQAITADQIASDIDRRPGAGETSPAFHRVRFDINVNVGGLDLTHPMTWSPELNLPATVSGLLDALEEAAQAAIEENSPLAGAEFQSLGDFISITAV